MANANTLRIIFVVSALFGAVLTFGQHAALSWKEYAFAEDGFAITFPAPPHPHPDPKLPDITVYSAFLPSTALVSVRVAHRLRNCNATLAQLKEGALKGKDGIDPSSVKDVSISGYVGTEYQYRFSADRTRSDSYYCVNERFYVISADWPGAKPRPPDMNRIVKSFRLLGTKSQK